MLKYFSLASCYFDGRHKNIYDLLNCNLTPKYLFCPVISHHSKCRGVEFSDTGEVTSQRHILTLIETTTTIKKAYLAAFTCNDTIMDS